MASFTYVAVGPLGGGHYHQAPIVTYQNMRSICTHGLISTSYASVEFCAVTVTPPIFLHIIVIYYPPGSLGNLSEELDILLSLFSTPCCAPLIAPSSVNIFNASSF